MNEAEELTRVSIVIPTLNEERYLPSLLSSLTGIEHIDVIVVDGNSDDNTASVVVSHTDRFIKSENGSSLRLIRTSVRNIAHQRNLGARAARHPILFFLDADVHMPSRAVFLELRREFLARELIVANPKFIPHPLDNHRFVFWGYAIMQIMQRLLLIIGKPIFGGACLITYRSLFDDIGGFDESLLLSEDADFGRRASRRGKCGMLRSNVATSTRRMKKIRIREALALALAIPGLVRNGRVSNSMIAHYGFGNH